MDVRDLSGLFDIVWIVYYTSQKRAIANTIIVLLVLFFIPDDGKSDLKKILLEVEANSIVEALNIMVSNLRM